MGKPPPSSAARSAVQQNALLQSLWSEQIDRHVLPNGLTVLLKRDASAAIASVQVWVKTGSVHEGAHLGAGLSHYLEHMLFKGTARRAGREISATVQAHGGYINAYTTFDRTVYYIDIPSEHAGVAIDLLADAVLHSTLPADEVAKEKDVILREIDMCLDDPDQRLGQALFETAFRAHPYRQPIIGHREVFAANTRDDLLGYYRERYTPSNLVVVIVGDIDPAATLAEVTKHFGAVPRRRLAPVLIEEEPAPLSRREHHRAEDVQVSRCGLGWHIPGLAHDDAPALDLLAMVLGHGESSLLWQAVREKARLVHTIDAMTWNPGSSGLFFVSFIADPDKRAAAEAAVLKEIVRITNKGIAPRLLAKAIRQAISGEVNSRKTMSGQAAKIGAAEVVVGDLHYSRRYFDRLLQLKPADLVAVARRHLVDHRLTVVSSNPTGAAAPVALRSLGEGGPAPDFEQIKLPNGARLLLQPDRRLPNLHLRLAFMGGPLTEPADKRGAVALLANLLTKDTKRRTSDEVAQAIEQVGGSFSDFTGNNCFGLSAEVLPGDADLALDLLGEAVHRPAFRPARLEIEREAALSALRESLDDVVTLGRKKARRLFFNAHPFAIEPGGDAAGLRAVQVDDLRRLHRELLVAGNAVLAVAGDFDPKKLRPKLEKLLARLPAGVLLSSRMATPPAPRETGAHVEIQPRQQAVVFWAYPGPGLRAADYYVSEVAEEIFSGMASQLFERVREQKGLAYFVRSSRVVGLDTAMFYFFAGTNPATAAEVLGEFAHEIDRVQSGGVTAEELRRCQTRLKAAKRMAMQTNAARALQAALNVHYGQPANDWRNYDARIDAVTLDAVRDFARAWFQPARRVELVVRP